MLVCGGSVAGDEKRKVIMDFDRHVLSFGAGVNSVALTILLAQRGWYGPVVFADTGTEWPETYQYIDHFQQIFLSKHGLSLTVLGGEWRENYHCLPLADFCEARRVTPSAGIRWCTVKYKVDPIHRWMKANGYEQEILGIAADEAHRKLEAIRPLVDWNIDRNGCARVITSVSLELPRKSSCYICPFQKVEVWRELYYKHPELYERVCRLEDLSSERRGEQTRLMASNKMTLRELQIGFDSQLPLFDDVEWYKPCQCTL